MLVWTWLALSNIREFYLGRFYFMLSNTNVSSHAINAYTTEGCLYSYSLYKLQSWGKMRLAYVAASHIAREALVGLYHLFQVGYALIRGITERGDSGPIL